MEPQDEVLEVGPGLGFMTAKLASRAKQVIAVELDDTLAEALKSGLQAHKVDNVQVWNQNILDLRLPPDPFTKGYKVVANLPYNITSVFLRKFLTHPSRPDSMVLLLQKEVAERIIAQPPDMSLLALSVQYYTEPRFVKKVTASNFWPQPKVDSAIIKLTTRNDFLCPPEKEKKLFQLARMGFSAKRKMLKNNLAGGLRQNVSEIEKMMADNGFNTKVRAQEISLQDWVRLLKIFETYI